MLCRSDHPAQFARLRKKNRVFAASITTSYHKTLQFSVMNMLCRSERLDQAAHMRRMSQALAACNTDTITDFSSTM